MAVNCAGCGHKANAQSSEFCEVFHTSSQIDECRMHTMYGKSYGQSNPVPNDRAEYIWLSQQRETESSQFQRA